MAFEGLTEKLSNAFKKLRGKGRLSESDVKESMREIRLALLEADVNYKVVKDFIKKTTERAVGTDVLESLSPAQMVIKIVNEELCALMGGQSQKLNIGSKSPSVVMLVGLQGAGKTTNGAKLAALMRKSQNKRPLLVACDVYRPAAIDQLKTVGKKLDLPVYEEGQGDPVEIAKHAIDHARRHGNDLVFLDTAGRLHIDEALMDELRRIKAETEPAEILLVVDAMTGQDAVNAAAAFDEALHELTMGEFPMRPMVVDPLTREDCCDNTGVNVPLIHVELEEGLEYMEIKAMPKGAGSGYWGTLTFLPPSAGVAGVKKFVVDSVLRAGSNPCPPLIVGVGIGGPLEEVARLATVASCRPIDRPNPRPDLAALEKELCEALNMSKIGAMGVGGDTTVLGVNIETSGSHKPWLPVAVNINCWPGRKAVCRVYPDGRVEQVGA